MGTTSSGRVPIPGSSLPLGVVMESGPGERQCRNNGPGADIILFGWWAGISLRPRDPGGASRGSTLNIYLGHEALNTVYRGLGTNSWKSSVQAIVGWRSAVSGLCQASTQRLRTFG